MAAEAQGLVVSIFVVGDGNGMATENSDDSTSNFETKERAKVRFESESLVLTSDGILGCAGNLGRKDLVGR